MAGSVFVCGKGFVFFGYLGLYLGDGKGRTLKNGGSGLGGCGMVEVYVDREPFDKVVDKKTEKAYSTGFFVWINPLFPGGKYEFFVGGNKSDDMADIFCRILVDAGGKNKLGECFFEDAERDFLIAYFYEFFCAFPESIFEEGAHEGIVQVFGEEQCRGKPFQGEGFVFGDEEFVQKIIKIGLLNKFTFLFFQEVICGGCKGGLIDDLPNRGFEPFY